MIRLATLPLALLAVAVMSPATVGAQTPALSAEDRVRVERLNAFLAEADSFLSTVNLYDGATLPITFPFREVMAHVVVDLSFDGKTALPFMLDTGAPTLVSDAIAEAHGGEPLVEIASVAGGGAIVWTPLELIGEATVQGSLPIRNMTAATGWAGGGAFHCISPHGLLGAPAMRNGVWQIDYGRREITVAETVDQLDHIAGAIALPFTVAPDGLSPTPIVELTVGGRVLDFVVDTGGGIPLAINTAALATTGIAIPEDAPAVANLAAGAAGSFELPVRALRIPVEVGGTEIETLVYVGDGMAPGAAGNIGNIFLRDFVVTFDWSTRTMHLDPLAGGGGARPLPPAPAAGIGLRADGSLHVASLVMGGAAAEAGLRLGETVVAINGQDMTGADPDAFCALSEAGIETVTTEAGRTYDFTRLGGSSDLLE